MRGDVVTSETGRSVNKITTESDITFDVIREKVAKMEHGEIEELMKDI